MSTQYQSNKAPNSGIVPVRCFVTLYPGSQIENLFFNRSDGFQKGFVTLTAGVFQSPILPVGTWQERTLDIAAHGNNHIHFRDLGQELTVLGGFHINAVDLLHQPDRLLIDLRFCFRTGRIAFKHIRCQFLSQRLRNLTAAGIVDTDKCNFLFQRSLAF